MGEDVRTSVRSGPTLEEEFELKGHVVQPFLIVEKPLSLLQLNVSIARAAVEVDHHAKGSGVLGRTG